MTNSNKKILIITLGVILITAITTYFLTIRMLSSHQSGSGERSMAMTGTSGDDTNGEPLYWVAPMDPDYRRDEPGKSPMGMELIPVYANETNFAEEGVGTIRISPDVVNNLGVRTGLVEQRILNTDITTVGLVQYDEDKLLHVHPRVEGWVETLFVKAEGDPVQAGEPLYQLYSPPLVNAQEEYLLAIGRGNPRLIEAAERRLKALQIDDKLIEQVKRERKVQQQITFYAPMSGVVDNLNIREGFYVQPGTTLLSIGSLDQVWVEAEVFERQASLVDLGLPVSMTLDYLPGRKWEGKVDYIYPSLDSKSRTLRVRLRFDNSDGLLKPNMYAQVNIRVPSDSPVLAVPRNAVIRTGTQDRLVLALGDGYFKSIAVGLGRMTQEYVEITSGLEEGEAVVTSAQFLLDSESSKTSDFMRLNHGDANADKEADGDRVDDTEGPKLAWVGGEIKSVFQETRSVSAYHEPIPDWQWPSMTMKFLVAEEVEFDQLLVGTQLHMQIGKRSDGYYEINAIHIISQPEDAKSIENSSDPEVVDQSDHQMNDQ